MTNSLGIQLESELCSKDVQQTVNDYGQLIDVYLRHESTVTRDRYGSIKTFSAVPDFSIAAFPINVNPTSDQMEKAGLREKTDLILWTAQQDWTNNNIAFRDLDHERATFNYDGQMFILQTKNQTQKIGNVYMYFVLGLNKK